MKTAFITGINGQDGSYLADLLLKKGYKVHGTIKRASLENNQKILNISEILNQIEIHTFPLDDHLSIYKFISKIKPDECYHLAASSFVDYSFNDETSIIANNLNSTHYLLSSIKESSPNCKFYLAGSSEMFGQAETFPQDENTKFNPRSIYGISKLSSYFVTKNYRDYHKIYACTGISYNHESPRRNHSFVSRKISTAVAKIYLGIGTKIEIGNLNAQRDWGYAPEYVEAMWKMLNNKNGPIDYVLSTGINHSVKDMIGFALKAIDIKFDEKYIETNKDLFRPSEQVNLIGNSNKIKKELNWEAQKKLEEIMTQMVLNDINLLKFK
jgi:GDPmannose 4,6-dehydratase